MKSSIYSAFILFVSLLATQAMALLSGQVNDNRGYVTTVNPGLVYLFGSKP